MKKRKKGWIFVVIIVLLLIALGVFLPSMLPQGAAGAGQLYKAEKAALGDIRVTVHGTGAIEPMDTSAVAATTTGKVKTVLVENGDTVKKGQTIATLDDAAANTLISSLKEQITAQDAAIAMLRAMPGTKYLTAPVNGRVKAVYAREGEEASVSMSGSGALMVLSTDGKMIVRFVPGKGIAVKAGAAVRFFVGKAVIDGFITQVPDSTTDEAEAVMNNDSVAPGRTAVIRDEKGTELGSGKLEINRPLLVTATSGTVDHLYVKAGDTVKAGAKLARLTGYVLDPNFESQLVKRQQLEDDLNDALADLQDLVITSPADGIVTDLAIQENGMTQEGMNVCTIQQQTGFKLVVAVDELDIPRIHLGQTADVSIDALPDETASGEVIRISPIGIKANDVTTYDVTLKLTTPAGALTKMSASADIEVAFKAGALLVPVEALHTTDGRTWVYLALEGDIREGTGGTGANAAQDAAAFRAGFFARMLGRGSKEDPSLQRQTTDVTVGLIGDSFAEILSGLTEGEEVAVPVAQSSLADMMRLGAMGGNRSGQGQNQPRD